MVRGLICGIFAGLVCLSISPALATDDVTYTYDVLGRLVRVDYASGSTVLYNYDAAGNRTSVVYGGVNSAPAANADSYSTNAKTGVTFDPRANDTDADSDALTISAVGTPAHGTVVNNSGQSLTYTPASTFPAVGSATGTDSFSYTIDDGHGHTPSGTITVTVTNRGPTATNDTVATNFNTPKSFDPRANDFDPDADTLNITSPTTTAMATTHGSVVANGGGTQLTYTPTTGWSGTESFNYTITDNHTHTATAAVTMTVSPQNQQPDARNDNGTFTYYTTGTERVTPIVTLDPRSNDTDPDGDALSVTAVTQPTSGAAHTSYTSTSVTYTYNTDVHVLETTDTFTYTISDGAGHTDTATVTIVITVGSQS